MINSRAIAEPSITTWHAGLGYAKIFLGDKEISKITQDRKTIFNRNIDYIFTYPAITSLKLQNKSNTVTEYYNIGYLKYSNSITNLNQCVAGNTNIEVIDFRTTLQKVSNTYQAFYKCSNLKLIMFDTIKATNWTRTFYNCTNLVEINGVLDFSKGNLSNTFTNCPKLEKVKLKNLASLQNSTSLDLSALSSMDKDSVEYMMNNLFDRKSAGYSNCTVKVSDNTASKIKELGINPTNKGFIFKTSSETITF